MTLKKSVKQEKTSDIEWNQKMNRWLVPDDELRILMLEASRCQDF